MELLDELDRELSLDDDDSLLELDELADERELSELLDRLESELPLERDDSLLEEDAELSDDELLLADEPLLAELVDD